MPLAPPVSSKRKKEKACAGGRYGDAESVEDRNSSAVAAIVSDVMVSSAVALVHGCIECKRLCVAS